MLGTIPSLLSAMLLTRAEATFVSRQVAECERNDQIRTAVTEIITEIQAALQEYYELGEIPKADFDQALARSTRRARLVSNLNCEAVVRGKEGKADGS